MFMKRSFAATLLIGVSLLSAEATAQAPLRLEDVYRVARDRNPRLQAAASIVNARRALEPGAGLPPDPQVQIGAMNFSVPDFSSMPTSMLPSIQVMQMLPLFGKLGLSERIAEQSTEIARAEAAEVWWQVRADAAMSFFEMYQADREIAVMKETVKLLEDFRRVAQAMYSAGQGRQADVLRAGVEVARMEAAIRRMEAMRTAAASRLNASLNQPGNTFLTAPVAPDLPVAIPSIDTLRAWAERGRPMLARGKAEVEQAGSKVALARKELWPDITVGAQYGQRRAEMTERMGSVMVGFSIPLFAGKRQLKMREEAEAMRAMAQSDLTRMRAQVDSRIVELVAELDKNRTLLQLYSTDVLPQAEANVQSSFSSYRVGQVDFMTLVDAQMTANKYKQELAALIAGYGVAVAELEMTIGRELPVTEALRAEVR